MMDRRGILAAGLSMLFDEANGFARSEIAHLNRARGVNYAPANSSRLNRAPPVQIGVLFWPAKPLAPNRGQNFDEFIAKTAAPALLDYFPLDQTRNGAT